jgi:Tfp pilus assembly protein PilN
MHLSKTRERLGEADENVRKGRARIAEQENRISLLATDSHETDEAVATLKSLKELQETMEKHR